MEKNVGTIDKSIRIFFALLFISLYFTGVVTGVLGIILLCLALIAIIVSFIGFCPLYKPLGMNTNKAKDSDKA